MVEMSGDLFVILFLNTRLCSLSAPNVKDPEEITSGDGFNDSNQIRNKITQFPDKTLQNWPWCTIY